MKRISLFLSFVFACSLGACASDSSVTCDVVWSDDNTEVGTATLVYEALDDVDLALEYCKQDQADHEQRPAEAKFHACSCST